MATKPDFFNDPYIKFDDMPEDYMENIESTEIIKNETFSGIEIEDEDMYKNWNRKECSMEEDRR